MPPVIRLANGDDADQIQKTYAPSVRETAISFELEVPTVAEMRRRILSNLKIYPWLVCENAGSILGFAYAGSHRTRAAYQWSDITIQTFVFGYHVHYHFAYRDYTAGISLQITSDVMDENG